MPGLNVGFRIVQGALFSFPAVLFPDLSQL